jgi:hypothetical protein
MNKDIMCFICLADFDIATAYKYQFNDEIWHQTDVDDGDLVYKHTQELICSKCANDSDIVITDNELRTCQDIDYISIDTMIDEQLIQENQDF